jgi:hypothetical protein
MLVNFINIVSFISIDTKAILLFFININIFFLGLNYLIYYFIIKTFKFLFNLLKNFNNSLIIIIKNIIILKVYPLLKQRSSPDSKKSKFFGIIIINQIRKKKAPPWYNHKNFYNKHINYQKYIYIYITGLILSYILYISYSLTITASLMLLIIIILIVYLLYKNIIIFLLMFRNIRKSNLLGFIELLKNYLIFYIY